MPQNLLTVTGACFASRDSTRGDRATAMAGDGHAARVWRVVVVDDRSWQPRSSSPRWEVQYILLEHLLASFAWPESGVARTVPPSREEHHPHPSARLPGFARSRDSNERSILGPGICCVTFVRILLPCVPVDPRSQKTARTVRPSNREQRKNLL